MYRILIPLILFFSFLLSAEMQSQEDMVKVPKLVGLDLGDARIILKNIGLNNNVFEQKFTKDYQPGTIFKQNPEPDSLVSLVTIVYLKVATKERVDVPNLVGQSLENARDSLQSIRLLLSQYQTVTTEHPSGTVIEQFPPAGSKVGVLTKVTLNVAKRPEMVEVPNLVGQSLENARDSLQSIQLPLILYETVTTEHPPDKVMEQFPTAGSKVGVGTAVSLTVAKRPETVDVPYLVGQPLENARDSLQRIRLILSQYQAVTTEHPPGTVIDQSPVAGSKVRSGTTIFLKVATISMMVKVPKLVGLYLGDARTTILDIGLHMVAVPKITTEYPPGTVLKQTPESGTLVLDTTTVYLIMAATTDMVKHSQDTVEVPDVVGQSIENAKDSLQSVRLPSFPYQTLTTKHTPGTIMKQFPAAGSKVGAGTAVYLEVAIISEIVDVPNVVGQPLGNARDSLQSIRLSLFPYQTLTTEHPTGTVMDQSPDAGSKVELGTTVYLKIALEEPPDPLLTLFYIVLSVIGILAASLQFRRIRKKKSKIKTAGGPTPDIRIKSQIHFGSQKIPQKTVVKSDLKVRLKPYPDKGKQNIVADDSLILKVPKGEGGKENTIAPSGSQIDDMDEAEMQALNSQITELWQSSKITTLAQLASMLNIKIKLKPVWDIGKQNILVEESLRKKMNIDIK